MLVEIKYIRKDEPKSLRQMRKASFLAESKELARAMFRDWCYKEGIDPDKVLVMVTRDATLDNITLDVHDIKQKPKVT